MIKIKFGPRTWILIVCLAMAFLAISPSFSKGVVIRSIEQNSTAFTEGLRQGMEINSINGVEIKDIEDYTRIVSELDKNQDNRLEITTSEGDFVFINNGVPSISVSDIPKTNIKTGLDLSGGARALVKASNVSLDETELNDLVAITEERLNTFGISDVVVRPVSDLSGENFMLIEIAGATPQDLRDLIGQQGVFKAAIGNKTVFEGGKGKDISDVCRNDATCSGIRGCFQQEGGYYCTFSFTLYLTEDAAKRHASMTNELPLDQSGQYLSEKLNLHVDGILVDSLLISSDLRGQVTTQISIQGSGEGTTQELALENSKNEMKKLQTILITGSLPYKLEIVKLDSISPTLGKQFTQSLIYLGLFVFAAVSVAIFVKYRKVKLTLAVMLTMFSEAVLTLGIAALIRWNLDAPGIAGIIAGIGTGVNDQIVILDESTSSKNDRSSVKERIKRALFIIVGAFFTIIAAMLPLFWAGAGLLRGFALTTILGVTIGILITRPAFAEIVRKVEEK